MGVLGGGDQFGFLQRAKDQNPLIPGGQSLGIKGGTSFNAPSFGDIYSKSNGGSTSFNTNYFPTVGKDSKSLILDKNPFGENEEKEDKGKSFLNKAISGGLDYFKKSIEKSDTDKLIDFAKSQAKAQFGGAGGGAFSEVAQGLSYGQLPAQSQQMFIPGQQGGKSVTQRIAGGAAGLLQGLSTGIPHAGGIGLVAGLLG